VQMGCGGLCRAMIGVRSCPNFHAPLEVWGAEYRSQGLIWGFAVVGGSAPAGSQDGSAALALDRLARVRLDRAPRPTTGIERHGDPGITALARCAPPPGRLSPAIVGGPSSPFRARAITPPTPPTPPCSSHHGTLLHWHADLVKRRWTYPSTGPGRPPTRPTVRAVILRLAAEKPTWGYWRIAGEIARPGRKISPARRDRAAFAVRAVARGAAIVRRGGRPGAVVDGPARRIVVAGNNGGPLRWCGLLGR
jgi:hypothetical protein